MAVAVGAARPWRTQGRQGEGEAGRDPVPPERRGALSARTTAPSGRRPRCPCPGSHLAPWQDNALQIDLPYVMFILQTVEIEVEIRRFEGSSR